MLITRAQRKLLLIWIISVIVKQYLVQIGRIDTYRVLAINTRRYEIPKPETPTAGILGPAIAQMAEKKKSGSCTIL
jgi:hypothetical protein